MKNLLIKKYFIPAIGLSLALCSVAINAHAQDSTSQRQVGITSNSASLSVSGTITDAYSKKGVLGIRVTVANFSAAITDELGRFTLKVPSYDARILISSEGYQDREIPLKGRTSISVVLNDESLLSLSDPLTLPNRDVSKKEVTASVQEYEPNGAYHQPFDVTDLAMQGRLAGLNVVRRSGTPGAGANLFLRGFTSLYATNKPLIVVDGMLFDANDYGQSIIVNNYTNPLNLLDIKDIGNITVLRDASSIYGTKGANGAILITTTKAKQQATSIDLSVFTGTNFAPKNLPVMDAGDYRTYLSEMLQSRGYTSQQIAALPYMNDNVATNPLYYQYHNNTNWQRQVMGNSMSQNLQLKVTGGDNIATYGLTLGAQKDDGIIKTTNLTRYNTRFNAQFNFSQRLTGLANLSFSYAEQNLKNQGIVQKTAPLYTSLIKAPFLNDREIDSKGLESPNYADRDTFGISNPAVLINTGQFYNKYYRFFGSFSLNYKVSKNIGLSTLVGITYDKVRETIFIPRKGVTDDTLRNALADSRLGSQVKRLYTLFNDTRLSYNRSFNRRSVLSSNLGFRFQNNDAEQDYTYGFNSATDELVSVQNGLAALRQVGGNSGSWSWINPYINADYGYAGKYFVSFNMAADGSSRFGKNGTGGIGISGHRFAIMPSVGAAWLISSERFMKNSSINLLKLRATYSITGNDDIGNYSAQQTYVSQNLLGMQGLVRSGIPNTKLQWETNTKMNVGLDLSFLNERITLNADAYRHKTTNMLVYETLATTTGFNNVLTNGGSMQTQGVDLGITARILNGKNLKWDLGLNVSTYKNKVLQVPGGSFTTDYAGTTFITANGQVANVFYGYKTNGVFATDAEAASAGLTKKNADGSYSAFGAGDVKFVDANGDKIIDSRDRQVIGNPNPDFVGGITNRITYKRFTLMALFTFSQGNDVYNLLRNRLEAETGTDNQLMSVNNRWRYQGQVTTIPKATWGDPMGNSRFSDRWIEDGSYIRLRTISLSYDVPFKSGAFLKNATVFANGTNLFTLTRYMGYDPEFSSNPSIFAQGVDIGLDPVYRSVMLGVRIGL